MAKKVQLQQHIKREKCKLVEIENNPEYDNGIQEDIKNRIKKLNDDLKSGKKASIFWRADSPARLGNQRNDRQGTVQRHLTGQKDTDVV